MDIRHDNVKIRYRFANLFFMLNVCFDSEFEVPKNVVLQFVHVCNAAMIIACIDHIAFAVVYNQLNLSLKMRN